VLFRIHRYTADLSYSYFYIYFVTEVHVSIFRLAVFLSICMGYCGGGFLAVQGVGWNDAEIRHSIVYSGSHIYAENCCGWTVGGCASRIAFT